mmetsp:Transcript_15647/g.24021  ORF Transcript_15647/g.24021 Transcript_15647/m.24021 type:complete len:461 (+) Transcript_15647:82-1464(+)
MIVMKKTPSEENQTRFHDDRDSDYVNVSVKRRKADGRNSDLLSSGANGDFSTMNQEQNNLYQLLHGQYPTNVTSATSNFSSDQHTMIPNNLGNSFPGASSAGHASSHLANSLSGASNAGHASNFNHTLDYEANIKAILEMSGSQQLGLQPNTNPGISIMQSMLQENSIPSFQHSLGSAAFFGNNSATAEEGQNVRYDQFAFGQRDQSAGLLDSQSQDSELLKLLTQQKAMTFDENQLLGMLAQNNANPLLANSYGQAFSASNASPVLYPNLTPRDQEHCSNQGQEDTTSLINHPKGKLSSSTNAPPHDPVNLYMKCDDNILSDYQILLRKQIEFFEAGPAEVYAVSRSRRKPIFQGQVGIRCKHCSVLPPLDQPKGAVYYPSYLRALYQAGQNMATSHFLLSCELINEDVKKKLKSYREGQASVGHGGKKYWEDCARAVSILEPKEGGLRFRKQHNFPLL